MTPVERLRAWGAEPTGETWATPSSRFAAGIRDGLPVVVKAAHVDEEVAGNRLLTWWAGRGAVPVLEHEDDAVLMVRAVGRRDLARMARGDADAEATAVLVDAARILHASGVPPASVPLVPLRPWFRELLERRWDDPLLDAASGIATALLDGTEAADVVALHGDVHHGNVLDLDGSWVAIDPKGLLGHRAYDIANLLCNPDSATAAAGLDERLGIVTDRSGLDLDTVVRWTVAYAGLSAAWCAKDPAADDAVVRAIGRRLLPRV